MTYTCKLCNVELKKQGKHEQSKKHKLALEQNNDDGKVEECFDIGTGNTELEMMDAYLPDKKSEINTQLEDIMNNYHALQEGALTTSVGTQINSSPSKGNSINKNKKILSSVDIQMIKDKHMEPDILQEEKKSQNKYLTTDVMKLGSKNHKYRSIDEILKSMCMFEALYKNNKPYYDMEHSYYDIEHGKANRNSDITEWYESVCQVFEEYDAYYYIFDDCRQCIDKKGKPFWKQSIRIIVADVGYYEDQRDIPQPNHEALDKSVYCNPDAKDGGRQLMRMPYMTKIIHEPNNGMRMARVVLQDDKWVKLSYTEVLKYGETYAEWFIQDVSGEEKVVVEKQKEIVAVGPEVDDELAVFAIPKVRTALADDKQFKLLSMLITTQEWDWHQWRNLGWSLHNISDDNNIDLRPVFHELSSKSDLYDEDATDKMYDVAQPNAKHRLGIQSIIGLVKETHTAQCDMWQTTNKIEWVKEQYEAEREEWVEFEKKSDLPELKYYRDYRKICKMSKVPFDYALDWWNRAIVHIDNDGNGFFMTFNKKTKKDVPANRKGNTLFEHQDTWTVCDQTKLTHGLRKLRCSIVNPLYDHAKMTDQTSAIKNGEKIYKKDMYTEQPYFNIFGQFIEYITNYQLIASYNSLDFFPFLTTEDPVDDEFNMFCGFPLNTPEVAEMEFKGAHPFTKTLAYKHITEQICCENSETYTYLNKWVADMLQNPHRAHGIFTLLVGAQGTGKGWFYSFVSKLVGSKHSIVYNNIDRFFKQFNAQQANKIFVGLNEISDKGAAHKNHNQFKGMLDEKTMTVEPKGVDPYVINHTGHYLGMTNNDNALNIENSDRRANIIRVSDQYKNNPTYWPPMWEELRNPKILKLAFHYYAYHLSLEGFAINKPPVSQVKTEMKIASSSNTYKFIAEYAYLNDGVKINSQYLFNAYVAWAESAKVRVLSKPKFIKDLGKIGLKSKTVKIYGEPSWGFDINKDNITKMLGIWMQIPDLNIQDFVF